VLTTNRPDILEPALAARPGRIDLAVELPLLDIAARRRLLDLYARGLTLQDVDLDAVALQIDGDMVVTAAHSETALAELNQGGRLAQRLLGFRPMQEEPEAGVPGRLEPMMPTGFPVGWTASRSSQIER